MSCGIWDPIVDRRMVQTCSWRRVISAALAILCFDARTGRVKRTVRKRPKAKRSSVCVYLYVFGTALLLLFVRHARRGLSTGKGHSGKNELLTSQDERFIKSRGSGGKKSPMNVAAHSVNTPMYRLRARGWPHDVGSLTGTRRPTSSVCPSNRESRTMTTGRTRGTLVTATLGKDLLVTANRCAEQV
jgi:hypothetical protein